MEERPMGGEGWGGEEGGLAEGRVSCCRTICV